MFDKRLETILLRLVNKHLPYLANQQAGVSIPVLAGILAREGVLVMTASVDEAALTREKAINTWVATTGNLYTLLAEALFPSLTHITAVYADHLMPPVIVLEADCGAITDVFAGYVIPYLSARQNGETLSEAELRGIMDMVMDELEAADLAHARYQALSTAGIDLLRELLRGEARIHSLTDFKKPLFQGLKAPAIPPTLPETGEQVKLKTAEMFVTKVPIFFKPPPSGQDSSVKTSNRQKLDS